MTAPAARVLFDEPGPRGRARIRLFTVLALVLLAGLLALALYQFGRSGQLGRSRWLPFGQAADVSDRRGHLHGGERAAVRFAEWLERRIGSRVRSRVAGSGAEPPAGAPQTMA